MSDASSASVWNDDNPESMEPQSAEPKAKSPPPIPTSKPVVRTDINQVERVTKAVPTGDLIQFENEEERAATIGNGTPMPVAVSSAAAPVEKNPSMETLLRNFLTEEESYTQQDYLKRFYDFQQVRIEQEKIRAEPEFRTDCAVAPQHYARNRYRDILPYDHNRVEIRRDEENPEGYMNASLIQLPGGKTNFIAAQAPLPATLDEWWKMIDEHGVRLIVILCKLVELSKIKCERYWPEAVGGSELFGDYEIKLKEERSFEEDDEYLMRVLEMQNQTTGESRTVYQLHYREWPDHGCPSGDKQLLNMIDRMEAIHDETGPEAPILVHCSAGVGRTGTIIAVNFIREQMKAETLTSIDVYGLVIALRRQRASMVQTQDQYQFVHRCIASYCRRYLGIEEPKVDKLSSQLPVDTSDSVRLIAPPTPTTSDQATSSGPVRQPALTDSSDQFFEDDSDATSVPDFPDEPPAPLGPEDLGNSAAF